MTYKEDAEKIFNALFNLTKEKEREDEIFDVIKRNKFEDRLAIRKYYEIVYNKKSIIEDFEIKLTGHFSDVVKYLFMGQLDYDCLEIFNSLDSIRYDIDNIFEIITTKPYEYLQKLKAKYSEIYNTNLERALNEKFDEEIGPCLSIIMNTKREINPNPNISVAKIKVNRLIRISPNDWLKEPSVFTNIFAESSPQELIMIGRIYHDSTKEDFPVVIRDKLSSKKSKFLTEILYNTCRPSELFATKLYEAFLGLGTDTNTVNRILVTRSEIDMDLIKILYKYIYGVELSEDIIGDSSGNYQKILLELIKKK